MNKDVVGQSRDAPAASGHDVRAAAHRLAASVHGHGAVELPRDLERQFDEGLAWVHFPQGQGGLGADPALQSTVEEVLCAAGFPMPFEVNPLGYGMCGPTIQKWGTPAQCERYLRPLFAGVEIWCQLFSEPGAGSDLAGLATSARCGGDGDWIVNGQKVWTTLAQKARWGLLIARTDPEVVKHRGMTAFVVDMQSPGLEVRPLQQMSGESEFNEVFFDNVRVPSEQMLGPVGGGWRVAVTTLMNERVAIGGAAPPRGSGPISRLMGQWAEVSTTSSGSAYKEAVTSLWIRAELLRLTNARLAQLRSADQPGPDGSLGKIVAAQLNKEIYDVMLDLIGPEAMLLDYASLGVDVPLLEQPPAQAFLRARANSIEGGSTEIMKNVLAERVLGLPAEPRVDRDVPWSQVLRS